MLDLDAVHFNNAGASPCPRLVSERVTKHMELEARVGGYEAEARCQDELEGVYSSAAELINADTPDEIALQESASMAWARVFYAVAQDLQPGDRILTCMVEYGANYVSMLQASKRTGAHIEVVPSNSWGEVDVGELDKMIRAGGVKLVSITHVPTNGGVVNPAEEGGEGGRGEEKQQGGLSITSDCYYPLVLHFSGWDRLSCSGGRNQGRAEASSSILQAKSMLQSNWECWFPEAHTQWWRSHS
ncbi:unnamed protein product, partial [Discosporangium mesarthrocarpum]